MARCLFGNGLYAVLALVRINKRIMTREEEIQKIGRLIQKKLDRLKELDVLLDNSWHQMGLFDNTIEVNKKEHDIEGNEQLVFVLKTSM
tara:strand:- start:55 stop:321 length:267 start_codon:yes stop_codon:yes gene_type:complete